MDAFVKIRELARQKNAEMREFSATPRAIDLVRMLANKVDLELCTLDPSDALLGGALAVLARGDGAIYHVNNLPDEDLAALLAHELGHFHVHMAESATNCSRDDVDASAPSEASPVGNDRVAGYGPRERRELQANVFARELLLPQPQARALYLDSAKIPDTIAKDFGLPLAVARQQLIDALFIPGYAEPETEKAKEDPPLDSFQVEAATFSGAPLLLEAGPGTGKTRTLVARIVHLIQQNADPGSIVALTFSNKAALELSERVATVLPEAAANIWTGTFHAFGLEFVRKYFDHPMLGFPPDVSVIDKSDAVALLEEVLPLLPLNHYKNLWDPLINLKDILAAISRAKDELMSPADYKRLGQRMLDAARDDESREMAEKALEVAAVYERYEKLLAEHKLLDFGDLIMKPTLLLEEDASIRDVFRMKYRHVLVDEYQDVNRASARLLKALAGDGERLWVVGDARQSIYRFRGASSANMARFDTDFPRSRRLSLGTNYRSTQEIVDAYCGFSQSMTASSGMLPLKLKAHRGKGGIQPDLWQVADDESEMAAAVANVEELRKKGVPLRKQAMLFRSNSRLNEFAAALEARGIPVLHLGSLFERDEIRNLLSLLSLVADPAGGPLVRLATLEPYRAPLPDVSLLLTHSRKTLTHALDALRVADKIEGLSAEARAAFSALAKDLEGFSPSSSPWEILCKYLFERATFLKPLVKSRDVRDQMKCVAIWQFLNFVREPHAHGKGPPIPRLLERIRHLVVLGDERDLRQIPSAARNADALRMLTIHGSKGLEFEAVHIPGMTRGYIPLQYRGVRCPPPDGMVEEAGSASGMEYQRTIHAAEEECLYFVAMSRARTHLRHYGIRAKPSDFIGKVVPSLTVVRNIQLSPMPADAAKRWVVPVAAGTGVIEADELSRFDSCPRRFLYTYLLGLAGRQRETAFVKAHNCVYETINAASEHDKARDRKWLLQRLEASWENRGPLDHAYEADYRRIAEQTIVNFEAACAGLDIHKVEAFSVDLLHGKVEVNPDQVAKRSDGTMLLRRIRTGKLSKDEEDEWIYTLYHTAAAERYGEGRYEVEAVHLTGNTRTRIAPSVKKMKNRMEKAGAASASIHSGLFPPQPDAFSCPRCPHFFYCPSLPEGPVQLP
ncbi:MAG: ATP-dependent helicase [Candidatus Manganitrophus sp.]|nr:ATP-dependent helicase [Candidatus Manganitrophus sp.]WDT70561.1 MAG: ATP-dependent helicase [Candidatus Manganitrophus sp.]WDT82185.1 MAG: ATP-dependent helicase [Candidatus Manganitrophus sp.]